MDTSPAAGRKYDVIIVGGALSGAATAILLLRGQPKLHVLIVEKSTAFTRRVGEATVEVSTAFLTRELGLMQYLNEAHLMKQGMRFWFSNDQTKSLEDCSEIGGRYLARVPAFQVDRAILDEEVLPVHPISPMILPKISSSSGSGIDEARRTYFRQLFKP